MGGEAPLSRRGQAIRLSLLADTPSVCPYWRGQAIRLSLLAARGLSFRRFSQRGGGMPAAGWLFLHSALNHTNIPFAR